MPDAGRFTHPWLWLREIISQDPWRWFGAQYRFPSIVGAAAIHLVNAMSLMVAIPATVSDTFCRLYLRLLPDGRESHFPPVCRWDMYLTLFLSVTLSVGPGNVHVRLAPVSRSSVTCANHVRNVGHENVIAYTQPKRDRGRAPLTHRLASRVPTRVSWDPS